VCLIRYLDLGQGNSGQCFAIAESTAETRPGHDRNSFQNCFSKYRAGNTKGGSITVPLTSCLTGLDSSVLQIKTKIVSWITADSKPVKQEVNSTVTLPPLVFPV
jgi:hypothetical protein